MFLIQSDITNYLHIYLIKSLINYWIYEYFQLWSDQTLNLKLKQEERCVSDVVHYLVNGHKTRFYTFVKKKLLKTRIS